MMWPTPGPGRAAVAAPVAYLINEDFEGTGTPSGWSGNPQADFDYSADPLAGLQSLSLDSTVDVALAFYPTGGSINNSELWVKFMLKVTNQLGGYEALFRLGDSAHTEIARIQITPSMVLGAYDPQTGALDVTTVNALSLDTIYDVWVHYKKGSGSNGVLECSFATDGSARPNSGDNWCGGTNLSSTANAAEFFFKASGTVPFNGIYVVDNVQIADTDVFA